MPQERGITWESNHHFVEDTPCGVRHLVKFVDATDAAVTQHQCATESEPAC